MARRRWLARDALRASIAAIREMIAHLPVEKIEALGEWCRIVSARRRSERG